MDELTEFDTLAAAAKVDAAVRRRSAAKRRTSGRGAREQSHPLRHCSRKKGPLGTLFSRAEQGTWTKSPGAILNFLARHPLPVQ